MPDQKPTAPAAAPVSFPNVDRLIDLASDKDKKGSADRKEPQEKSVWKLLLQFRPFLPYIAKLVPMLDVAVGPLQSAGLASDVRKAVAESMAESGAKLQSILQSGLQSAQRDINTVTTALDRQSSQLERLEQELTRLGQASEKAAAAQVSLGNDLRSLTRMIQMAVIGGATLLVALIVIAAILLTHSR